MQSYKTMDEKLTLAIGYLEDLHGDHLLIMFVLFCMILYGIYYLDFVVVICSVWLIMLSFTSIVCIDNCHDLLESHGN
jgi:hypothetical protein